MCSAMFILSNLFLFVNIINQYFSHNYNLSFFFQKSSGTIRVTFIPNADITAENNILNKLMLAALESMTPGEATDFSIKVLQQMSENPSIEEINIPVSTYNIIQVINYSFMFNHYIYIFINICY